ncbi:MAG TPA: tRNA (adenosine(37)-N6)-threonylcarbamoyltransferase complex dimerization subunit type 1 TsaB, partial [Gammaproteobacteria bacterium]|nr:tRNA (adenosine(37)-N6)-threonylcarbamoyltransferase complex dimerization subunit type 1 TsaB [Gammaproteobacteria bacterium]
TAPERLIAPQDVQWPAGRGWIAAGSGFANYVELRAAAAGRGYAIEPEARPAARDVLPLARAAVHDGRLVAAEHWEGRYLRDETAWKTKE